MYEHVSAKSKARAELTRKHSAAARSAVAKRSRQSQLKRTHFERGEVAALPAVDGVPDPIEWFGAYCRNPDTGEPFEFYPQEVAFLREALTLDPQTLRLRYSEVIFSAPKKSGKTLIAALCIIFVMFALAGDNAEGYIASNSREQAKDRVFMDVKRVIEKSPQLKDRAILNVGSIEILGGGSFIRTVTGEAGSAAGGRPSIVTFDELWGFTSTSAQRLWDEMVITPTVPISMRLTTTYAGFVGESELLEGLYRQIFTVDDELEEGVECIGTDLYRRGRMLVYWTHEWRAPWQTPDWIEEMRRAYAKRPNQFQRIMCNRWVSAESSFIGAATWDLCVDKRLAPIRRAPRLRVYAAVDAAVRKDTAAIVTAALDEREVPEEKRWLDDIRRSDAPHENMLIDLMAAVPWREDFEHEEAQRGLEDLKLFTVDHRIIRAHASGQIPFAEIEGYLIELNRRFDLQLVLYDPYQMVALAQGLTRIGIPMRELAQTAAHVIGFSGLLFDLLEQRRLRVYPSEELRSQALNAVAKESARGWHIVKRSRSANVDSTVALAMACYGAAMSFGEGDEEDPQASGGAQVLEDIYAV